MDPFKGGIQTNPERHKVTTNEHFLEIDMGQKTRVEGFDKKRNQLPFTSLGDKPYKFTEDSSGFFKAAGLIPGSTNPEKMDKKGGGNSKIVDYYATLDLTKKIMNKDMLWTEKVKKEVLTEDKKAVSDLIAWYFVVNMHREKSVLKESDPKYYDPDVEDDDFMDLEEPDDKKPKGKDGKKPAGKK